MVWFVQLWFIPTGATISTWRDITIMCLWWQLLQDTKCFLAYVQPGFINSVDQSGCFPEKSDTLPLKLVPPRFLHWGLLRLVWLCIDLFVLDKSSISWIMWSPRGKRFALELSPDSRWKRLKSKVISKCSEMLQKQRVCFIMFPPCHHDF